MPNNIDLYRPIPELRSPEGWKDVPIEECGEPLVPIGPMSAYPLIATDAIYAGEHATSPYRQYGSGVLEEALLGTYLREGPARRLMRAHGLLPPRCMFLVWDAYRPLAVQTALFVWYVQKLVDGGMDEERAQIEAQRFVSRPSEDPPSLHLTGAAIDLTIIRFPNGVWNPLAAPVPSSAQEWETWCRQVHLVAEPLAMGTVFDAVQPETATRFYEELPEPLAPLQEECRNNRRLLYNVMTAAGFSNYPEEWWHFNAEGTQMDAAMHGSACAIYGAAPFSLGNQFFETRRSAWHTERRHRHGTPLQSAHPRAAML